jgi:hypothetical protein
MACTINIVTIVIYYKIVMIVIYAPSSPARVVYYNPSVTTQFGASLEGCHLRFKYVYRTGHKP